MEGLIEFFIVANIHITQDHDFAGKPASLVFVILYLICCGFILPIVSIWVLCRKNLRELHLGKFRNRYLPLYEMVRTTN